MIGARSSNSENIAGALRERFDIQFVDRVRIPNPLRLRGIDVVYGVHLQTCSRYIAIAETLHKKTVIHFVGSDAYRYSLESGPRKTFWKHVVNRCGLLFFASSHLRDLVGRKGPTLAIPLHKDLFRKSETSVTPERDVLYYCPGGATNARIYRLDWIVDYACKHPEETITIIGNPSCPAQYDVGLPNVEVVPSVTHDMMRDVYARHRRLIRMTTQDGMPSMVDEALLCGLDVMFNEKRISQIQPERDPAVFARRFEEELRTVS